MAEPRERRGLQDGGDRIAGVARWLARIPPDETVTQLVLSAKHGDDGETILAVWSKADVRREIALEVSALVQELADETGSHVRAKLEWRTEAGVPHLSRALQANPARVDGAPIPIEPFDGSAVSMLRQTQRHNELMMREMHELLRTSTNNTERLFGYIDRVLERLEDARTDADATASQAVADLEATKELAERAVEQAEAALDEASKVVENNETAQVLKLVAGAAQKALAGDATK